MSAELRRAEVSFQPRGLTSLRATASSDGCMKARPWKALGRHTGPYPPPSWLSLGTEGKQLSPHGLTFLPASQCPGPSVEAKGGLALNKGLSVQIKAGDCHMQRSPQYAHLLPKSTFRSQL